MPKKVPVRVVYEIEPGDYQRRLSALRRVLKSGVDPLPEAVARFDPKLWPLARIKSEYPPEDYPWMYDREACYCGGQRPLCTFCEGSGIVCPVCKGAGYTVNRDGSEVKILPCSKCEFWSNQVHERLVIESGMTEVMQTWTFENIMEAPYLADVTVQCLEWARGGYEEKPWLVLHSAHGAGKTYLAVAIINEVAKQGMKGVYFTASELMEFLRAKEVPGKDGTRTALSWLLKIREVPLLVIDEFGRERKTPLRNEKIFDVLDYRADRSWLPTVLLTNMVFEEIPPWLRSRLSNPEVRWIDLSRIPDLRPLRRMGAEELITGRL